MYDLCGFSSIILGLSGIGAWHAWGTGDTGTGNSVRKMRKVKVYIKCMHKGQCGEPIQGAGLLKGEQLETGLHTMDKFLYKFNAFLHKMEQEQISRTTRLNDGRASVIRSKEYINMQQNRPSSELFPDVLPADNDYDMGLGWIEPNHLTQGDRNLGVMLEEKPGSRAILRGFEMVCKSYGSVCFQYWPVHRSGHKI